MFLQNIKTKNTKGLGEWLDTVINAGTKLAEANAARRHRENAAKAEAAATQAAINAANIAAMAQYQTPQQSNTLMYVGIGAAILAVGGIAYFKLKN